MLLNKALRIVLLCFSPVLGVAQNLSYIHYTSNNSRLPHDIIYKVTQDPQGYMWICTDDGLVRFDGNEMVNYAAGFVSKYTIATDIEQERVWIATWKGGIHCMGNDTFFLPRTLPDATYTYSSNDILAWNDLVISYTFDTYIVFRFNDKEATLSPFEMKLHPAGDILMEPGNKEYYHFLKTASHRLLAYNENGIYEVQTDGTLRELTCDISPDGLWESPSGILYYRKGLEIYKTVADFSGSELAYTLPRSHFNGKEIQRFQVLPSGNICISVRKPRARHHGIDCFLVNVRTGEITDLLREVRGESVASSLTVDREGGIWLSTDGDGLYHIFDKKYTLLGGETIFDNASITDLLYTPETGLYIGTKKGIYTYCNDTLRPLPTAESWNYHVKRFCLTPDGKITASWRVRGSIPCAVVHPLPLKPAEHGEEWSLPGYSLRFSETAPPLLLDRTGQIEYGHQQIPVLINDAEEDESGTLWLGFNNGVYTFHPLKGLVYMDSCRECVVNDLLYQRGKGMWMATNKGLYLITPKGECLHWGESQGLSNLNLNCLFSESPSSLWIGSQNGLFKLCDNEFRILKKRDGLIADDVSCFAQISEHELAVGSSKGISLLYLNEPFSKQEPPELIIGEIKVNNNKKQGDSTIDVPYGQSIVIGYNAITLVYPELVSFEYRLNDGDPWIKTSNRSLVFSNLNPGNYRFQVRAKKHSSDFSPATVIPFNIASPWWMSGYFLFFSILIAGTSVFGLLYIRLKKRQEETRRKQELSSLRLKALQTQLNPHFISNSLNAIQYFTLKRDEITANEYLTRFADLTRLLLETSRTKFVTLKTEIEVLQLYLSLEKLRFEEKFDYTIEVGKNVDLETVFLPGMLLQPFAENSVNHGLVYLDKQVKGLLKITVTRENPGISIVIDDNGIGRSRAKEIRQRVKKSYTSRSTEIIREMQNTINNIPGCVLEIDTLDKTISGEQASGTTVNIFLYIDNGLAVTTPN